MSCIENSKRYFLRGEFLVSKNKEKITESLRSEQRAKRRKTNLILNSLIVVVLLLIVIVSVNIFGKDDGKKVEKNTEQTVASTVKEESNKDDEQSQASDGDKEDAVDEEDSNTEEQDLDEEEGQSEEEVTEDGTEIEDAPIVTEGGTSPNVNKTIKNPGWEPVGTSQTEPAQDYNRSGVDWNEQVQAVSHATGFDQGKGDILVRLENNGPKKSAATVIIKETNKKYRVYLEWVDGKGWKPALVEERAN